MTLGDVTIVRRVALLPSTPRATFKAHSLARRPLLPAWLLRLAARFPLVAWLLEFISSLWGPLVAKLLRVS